MTSNNSTTKTCSKCLIEKLACCFYKAKSKHDGLASHCKECARLYGINYRAENKEKIALIDKAYKLKNKEKIALKTKEYIKNNPLSESQKLARSAATKKHRDGNKGKIYLSTKEYRRNNRGKRAAAKAKYRARKMRATPSWVNAKKIETIYINADFLRKSGVDVQVDHAIPLQGKLVSGLHVESNLKIISAHENRVKHNSYDIS